MVRIPTDPLAFREDMLQDLRDEFLVRCQAKNLSPRTIEWYAKQASCSSSGPRAWGDGAGPAHDDPARGVPNRGEGGGSDAEHGPGYAQTLKTLSRFGHKTGTIPENITADFEMPKVPQVIIQTFYEEQLRALLRKPDTRRWLGVRDRAILLTFLDTLVCVSELVGVNAEDADLKARTMRVLGKGAKQRELPLGQTVIQALRPYQRLLEDVRPEDPFFVSRYGGRITKKSVHELVAR
jgi:integrase